MRRSALRYLAETEAGAGTGTGQGDGRAEPGGAAEPPGETAPERRELPPDRRARAGRRRYAGYGLLSGVLLAAAVLIPLGLSLHNGIGSTAAAQQASWAPGVTNQHVSDRAERTGTPEPMDGDDPRARGCGPDATTVAEVPLLLPGGHRFGTLRLRHSQRCGTSWGSAYYANPDLYTVRITARRPADGAEVRSDWSNNTPPGSYGDMLSTGRGCVQAEAVVITPHGTSAPARTGCRH